MLYWVEGFNVERFTKCAVNNRTNWSCKYDDGSAEFGFNNGRYREISFGSGTSSEEYVYYASKWQWLNQGCQRTGLLYPACMALGTFL